jgi:hypothetical protein
VDSIAHIIGEVLGWSAKERKASIAHYRELISRQNDILIQAKEVTEKVS